MTKVIKRSGRRQNFSVAKVKCGIERAAKDAKLTKTKREALAKEVSTSVASAVKRKRSIRAADLRRAILGRVERRSKKTATAWKRFDRKRR